jgi:hypothetical protein
MSADTTPSPVGTETANQPSGLVALLAQSRQTTLIVLLVVGLIGLIGAGICVAGAVGKFEKKDAAKKDLTESLNKSPLDEEKEKKPEKSLTLPYQSDYTLGAICFAMLSIAGLGLAVYHWLTPPGLTEAERFSLARKIILLGGGLIGLSLMIGAIAFFLLWFKSASLWIDEKKASEAKFVLLPVLTFLLGAGLAFVSTGPARAEERQNPMLRRLIYGSNLVISIFLVGLLLVILNAFIAVRLPNRLDTTEAGVNSIVLSESTKQYLLNLNRKVVVYTLLPESNSALYTRIFGDTRKLLSTCSELNPNLFVVNDLSFTLNRSEVQKLQSRFPQIDKSNPVGLLVTIEDDEKRARFIPFSDLVKEENNGMRRGSSGSPISFVGEAKLVGELITLGEDGQKPVIYFTQSAKELSISTSMDPKNAALPERQCTTLKKKLEAAFMQVKELKEDINPNTAFKVPDDAAVVVVADPLVPLSQRMLEALKTYMSSGDKKGRLVVLSGAHTDGGSQAVLNTGIEPLLVEYGISLRPEALYAQPSNRSAARSMLGGMNPALIKERNPIAQSYGDRQMPFINNRAIDLLSNPPPNGSRAQPIYLSSESRATWREPEVLRNPEKEFENIVKNASQELFARKQILSPDESQILAALSSDENGGRVIVFGTGELFSDDFTARNFREPIQAELLAGCCNWLVKRPEAANVVSKPYGYWVPPANVEATRVFFLPVGIVLLGILAVGAGVWVFRRK